MDRSKVCTEGFEMEKAEAETPKTRPYYSLSALVLLSGRRDGSSAQAVVRQRSCILQTGGHLNGTFSALLCHAT